MNRNLLILSLFLILAGFFSGLFLISFFGLILLIPALASPSRLPTRPSPYQPKPAPRRITPPPTASSPPPSSAPAPAPTAARMPAYTQPPQTPIYSPALFPSPLMPSLSTMGSTQPTEKVAPKRDEKDELVEAGAILAALKMIFG